MKIILSILLLCITYSAYPQKLLQVTFKEKRKNYSALKFISLSDSAKQVQFAQLVENEEDVFAKMQSKKLIHHSEFANVDSTASWNVVAYPINVECLIRDAFPKQSYIVYPETKVILGYRCRKAVMKE